MIIFPMLYNIILQFSSVAQSCLTLCDPMNCSTPGLPVHHQLPEFTQTHIHRVSDAIQPSHPLSSPSPPTPIYFIHSSLYLLISYPCHAPSPFLCPTGSHEFILCICMYVSFLWYSLVYWEADFWLQGQPWKRHLGTFFTLWWDVWSCTQRL